MKKQTITSQPKNHHRIKLGKKGELIAENLLKNRGYKILARNLHLSFGEIDILAQDKDSIVIVEVKTKTHDSFGKALEMFDSKKQAKLKQLYFEISRAYPNHPIRVDAVAIDSINNRPTIEIIKNILEE